MTTTTSPRNAYALSTQYSECPEQQPGEPITDYHARVLTYALTYGIEPLTLSQLDAADAQAQQHVTAQPGKLNPDQARLDAILHDVRSRLQARIASKRSQLAATQRLIDQAHADASQAVNAPQGGAGMAELSTHEQACRLLAAALRLILEPGSDGGGGSGARLIPPKPSIPPAGRAINPHDNIQF